MYMFYKCLSNSHMKVGQKFKHIKKGEACMINHLNTFKEFYEKHNQLPYLIEVYRGNKLVKELEPILNNDGSFSLRKIETIRFF